MLLIVIATGLRLYCFLLLACLDLSGGLAVGSGNHPDQKFTVLQFALSKQHFDDGMACLRNVIAASMFYDDVSVKTSLNESASAASASAALVRQLPAALIDDVAVVTAVSQSVAADHHGDAVHYAAVQIEQSFDHFYRSYSMFPTFIALETLRWLYGILGRDRQIEDSPETFPVPLTVLVAKERTLAAINQISFELHRGDFSLASQLFATLRDEIPGEYFEFYFNFGVSRVKVGDWQGAIENYEYSLFLQPLHTKSLLNLASVYQQCGQFELAQETYQVGVFVRRVSDAVTAHWGYSFMSDDYIKMRSNLALTLFQQRRYVEVSAL
jgi:tetratricopeptide (TPR) repeat protein